MSRRWECPNGRHPGVLGPERPRRDDVRRYCLPCSEATGRLVERTAPAVEKARAERAERSAAKRSTATQRAAAAELTARSAGGIDLQAEAARFWRLPVLREARGGRATAPLPTITWRRARNGKAHTSGHIDGWRKHVVVTIGTDVGGAVETVLHELVHASLPYSAGHSDRFWSTLRSAAREAFPDADYRFHEGRPNERGYALDNRIGQGINRALAARAEARS